MNENISIKFNLLEKKLKFFDQLNSSFDYLKMSIASPEKIRNWAEKILPNGQIYGEVFRPDTINFKTYKPQDFGLFCEKLFGPIKDWTCGCGKYSSFVFENLNKVCEKCFVEITESRVRRYRMAYIELICPIAHCWYMKGNPNYILTLLKSYSSDLKASDIEQIIYFKEGFRNISDYNSLAFSFISKIPNEFLNFSKDQKTNSLNSRLGSEILKAGLEALSLPLEIQKTRSTIYFSSLKKPFNTTSIDKGLLRRLRILENFLATNTNPSWLILTTLPVLPPTLRPLIELSNGKLISADLNEFYKLIITRNQRLFEFLHKYEFPNFLSTYVRRLLQESIDALIDNAKLPKNKRLLLNNKPLKGLSEVLEGKYGRFRHSLLGKRVDFSARSIIVVNPFLRLNQCGLPYQIAVQLFHPFLINELMKLENLSFNKKLASRILKQKKPFVWVLLNKIVSQSTVLLNRAPTLHRFGIQAFNPVLITGQAIQLHPLVCTGFNADFDGDQMAVHLPLSYPSQMEAKFLMSPRSNLLSPANAEIIVKPTQDIVIGCYYLTLMLSKESKYTISWFKTEEDALIAFYQKKLELHTPIFIKYLISSFLLQQKNEKFYIKDLKVNLFDPIEIIIYKFVHQENKYYLLSNLGILVAEKVQEEYMLKYLFIETTVGRVIFNKNLQNHYNTNLC